MLMVILIFTTLICAIVSTIFEELTVNEINNLTTLERLGFTFANTTKKIRFLGITTAVFKIVSCIALVGVLVLLMISN